MSPTKPTELSAQDMLALRTQTDALKVITEKLRVKEMGPADHIRTKHEVKAFLETSGEANEAEAIIVRARARRELWVTQSVAQNLSERQQRSQRMDG